MISVVLFGIVIFFAMFVQGLTGFGGPLLAMPFGIVLLGIQTARPTLTILACLAASLVAVPRYKDINVKKFLIMTAVMLAGVIAGDLILNNFSLKPLLILYAVVVMIIGFKRLLVSQKKALPVPLQYGALGIAGIMQGMFISGGSFLVLYAVEKIKNKDEFRATVSAVWVPLNVYLIIKYLCTGVFTVPEIKLTALMIIPEVIGIWLAGRLVGKLNQDTFLKITYAILALSGIVLLINSLI